MRLPKDFELIKAAKHLFTQRNKSVAYDPVQGKSEDDNESGNDDSYAEPRQRLSQHFHRPSPRKTMLILVAQILMTVSSIIFAASGFWTRASHEECPRCYVDDEQCAIHLSTSSPLIDANIVEYQLQQWPSDPNADMTYQGPPTFERELAWRELEGRRFINVPQEYLARLGKAENVDRLMTEPEFGGGYAAYLEVHHQLYCLAALRRWTYKDEYLASMVEVPEVFSGTVEEVHRRLDHCIETLRVSLMCTSDVTPMLLPLNLNLSSGFALDFGTQHKCRNFEKIVEWEEKNRAKDIEVSFGKLFNL